MMEVFSRVLKRVEGASLIRGIKTKDRQGDGVYVSHLLFADDKIIFRDEDVEQILHIQMLLLYFQIVTG